MGRVLETDKEINTAMTVELVASNLADYNKARNISQVVQTYSKLIEYNEEHVICRPQHGIMLECQLSPKRTLNVTVGKNYWEYDTDKLLWVDFVIEGKGYRVTLEDNSRCKVEMFACLGDMEDGEAAEQEWLSERGELKFETI